MEIERDTTIFIEAESFEDYGGWVIDQQSMYDMGSPYLLAHGLGEPVEDATKSVDIPEKGEYSVWVRTRDWVAPWGVSEAPGRFQLLFNKKPLDTIFGTKNAQWHWQYGGTISLERGSSEIALHDLTGFEGRCDAIILTKDREFTPPDEGEALCRLRCVLYPVHITEQAGKAGRKPGNQVRYRVMII